MKRKPIPLLPLYRVKKPCGCHYYMVCAEPVEEVPGEVERVEEVTMKRCECGQRERHPALLPRVAPPAGL